MLAYRDKRYLLIKQQLKKQASLLDFKCMAARFGVNLEGYRISDTLVYQAIKPPFVTLFEVDEANHYIVVLKMRKKRVLILDGTKKMHWIKQSIFLKKALGYVLAITSIDKHKLLEHQYIAIKLPYRFLNTVLYIASVSSLIGGLYFIDTSVRFFVPLLLFALGAILMLFSQAVIKKTLLAFDRLMIDYHQGIDSYQTLGMFYEFKAGFMKRPFDLLNSIAIIMFITLFLAFDDIHNLIPLAIIGVATLVMALFEQVKLTPHVQLLARDEANLFNHNTSFSETISNINSRSYTLSAKIMTLKVINVFFLATVALLSMALRGTVYLNYFLFQLASFHVFSSNITQLFKLGQARARQTQLAYLLFIDFKS